MDFLYQKVSLFLKGTFVSIVIAIFVFNLSSAQYNRQHSLIEAAEVIVIHTDEKIINAEANISETLIPVEPIKPRDDRAVSLQEFLQSKNSYLANYTDLIVEQSDFYGVDHRLPVAISGVESGYCAVNFRPFNCWGYGSFGWSSPEEAIKGYMFNMNKGYFSKGATTPETIARIYNPHPQEYAQKVYGFLNKIP